MAESIFEKIANLGEIDELIAVGKQSSFDFKSNGHIHLPPNFSAFNTIDELITKAKQEDIKVLGCSNYYDYSVYNEFAEKASAAGIFPIFGTEIIVFIDELAKAGVRVNDPNNAGRMYLCGKGIIKFNKLSAEANCILTIIRKNDSQRMRLMIEKLNTIFSRYDITLTEQEIISEVANRCRCDRAIVYLQERHLARAYQQAIFEKYAERERKDILKELIHTAVDFDNPIIVQNALRSALLKAGKPAYVEEKFVDFNSAVKLIDELGGIVCYPILADGANPICEYETPIDTLIDNLRQRNIDCVEFIPLRNDVNLLTDYVKRLDEAGFIILAGTEHNTPELLPVEPACKNKVAVPPDISEIFNKGVAFVAGYQYLAIRDINYRQFDKYEIINLGAGVIEKFTNSRGETNNELADV